MITVNDYKLNQTKELLNSTFNTNHQNINKNNKLISEEISSTSKNDILTLTSQISSANSELKINNETDFAALEKKLGIDSSKWGVEAVSDDIFNFAKVMYEDYKTNHSGEDSQKVLENFYNMAKDSINKGYEEAMDFLGALSDDVAALTKGTLDKSLEKLEAWFKNGGKDVEPSETATETTKETAIEKENKLSRAELLKESEDMKNQVLDMLKQQGIYLTEKKTKKSFFELTS
jgi:hypothetical protein